MYIGEKNKKNNYKNGQAMLIAVVFFLFVSITVVFGIATPILKQVRISKDLILSKGSYELANGAIEDILYRLQNNKQVASSELLTVGQVTVTSVVTNTATGKQIISTANIGNKIRKIKSNILLGTGISFHYGVQAGMGGFVLQNSSSITGNVFSGGTITGSGNYIYGDVISAGASGLISGIHATGTAYSHTIQNSTIDKNAYYQTINSTTVSGSNCPNPHCFPGSVDQTVAPLPISDTQITDWETEAASGGTASCSGGTYTINSTVTIGPKKIPCNLVISNSAIVTITGYIWVTGNITVQNSSLVKMDPSLGSQNVAIIADNPVDRLNSSIFTVANSATFQNSGTAGSFVFLISMNNSAESGGGVAAFSLSNSASALVAYAPHGLIPISNSVSLKEVTAYRITMQNSSNIKYDTGLPSVLFDSGPAGGYEVIDWYEIP